MNYIENINFNKDLIKQRLETRDSFNYLSNNNKINHLIKENIEYYKLLNKISKSRIEFDKKLKEKPKPKSYKGFDFVKGNSEVEEEFDFKYFGYENHDIALIDNK